tara:strand:- start:2072 stop:2857 length:786 start_codon:yes stop_codon:yes gene_type:complete
MFDSFIFDIAFIQTTFVFVLLIAIALWQKLKQFIRIMCGIYLIFLVFSIFDSSSNDNAIIIKNIDGKTDTVMPKNLNEIYLVDQKELSASDIDLKPIDKISAKTAKDDSKLSDKKTINLLNKYTLNSKNKIKDGLIIPDKVAQSQIASGKTIKIKYFKLGRGLKNRELIDIDSTFYTDDERIYCLTNIQNQNNDIVIFHNWYRNNKLLSKIRMEIGRSYNWRTWSYINVNNKRAGDWKIVVTDSLNVRHDSLFFNIENTLE